MLSVALQLLTSPLATGTFKLANDATLTKTGPGLLMRLFVYMRETHDETLFVIPTLAAFGLFQMITCVTACFAFLRADQ